MLQSVLKRWFGSLKASGSEAAEPVDDTAALNRLEETITRLQRLVEDRSFVEVRFPIKSNHAFQSLVLKVDPVERYLLIDELFPVSNNIIVDAGDVVEITSQSKGMPVKFRTTIESVNIMDADGMPAYRLALPGTVKAEQRRRNFRVALEAESSGVRLRIRNPDGSKYLCSVLNLSHGGVGFSCQGNLSERLRTNSNLNDCLLSLPDNPAVKLDLEVRSFEYRRHPYRHTLVGSRIARIEPGDERAIDQFLIGLQRQLRRDARQED